MSEKEISSRDILKELKPVIPPKNKEARGFSEAELKEVNLSIKEALKLKIPVDIRRKTKYQENVEKLKKVDLNLLRELVKKLPKKRIDKKELAKKHRKRVFRGLTAAGKKSRGLLKLKLKVTHKHKWKKKQKEREKERGK